MVGSSMIHRKAKGEVKVAVIKRTLPSDADLMSAHQTGQRIWIEGFSEKSEVISLFPQVVQMYSESSQRHIRDGEKLGETDAEAFAELAPVIPFEGGLRRRQEGTSRIVDKI
jgi:hypothetical protein